MSESAGEPGAETTGGPGEETNRAGAGGPDRAVAVADADGAAGPKPDRAGPKARTGDGKARWYRPLTVVTDACGIGVPLAAALEADGQDVPVIGGLVGAGVWAVIRTLRRRYAAQRLGESWGVLAAVRDWVLLAGVLALALILSDVQNGPRPTLALASLMPGLALTATVAPVTRLHLNRQRRQARAVRRALVVGEPTAVDHVVGRLAARTDHPYVVVGVVPVGFQSLGCGMPAPGRLAAFPADLTQDADVVLRAVEASEADVALVAPGPLMAGERLRHVSWALHGAGLQLAVVPGLTEVAQARVRPTSAAGLTLLQVTPPAQEGGQPWLKSLLDRAGATVGLILLAPLFGALAVAVRCSSPGPVFHRQTRCGLGGEPFTMWKFRTMVVDAEARRAELARAGANQHDGHMFKMRRDPRVTRLGGALRRLSLDELPQLFNVLRGDMSLIGPRPPLPEEVARYNRTELRRLSVKPGMTGLWQVSGRSDLSWDETVALDLWYVDNWSVATDVEIMTRTLRAVVDGRGAY